MELMVPRMIVRFRLVYRSAIQHVADCGSFIKSFSLHFGLGIANFQTSNQSNHSKMLQILYLYYNIKTRMEDPIADFLHWYKTRPIITKTFLTLSTILAICITMEWISIHKVYYTLSVTYPSLQLWRPLTSLLFLGYLNFNFILDAYFAYHCLISAQIGIFERKDIGHFWYLIIYLFVGMVAVASVMDLYFISDGFLFGLIYIYCKIKPFNRVELVFGINMPSGYFPWFFLGIIVLFGQSFINMIAGFLIAHLYLYVKGPLKEKTGIDFLKTPSLLHSLANIYNRRIEKEQASDQYQRDEEDRQRERGNEMRQENENDDMYQ